MRLIANFENQVDAKKFSQFLTSKNIENTCEITLDKESGKTVAAVWVHEEDQVEEALKYHQEYLEDPNHEQFNVATQKKLPFSAIENPGIIVERKKPKTQMFWVTYFFLGLCSLIFFLNYLQERKIISENPNLSIVLVTPIQEKLMFDAPTPLLKIQQLLAKYQIKENMKEEELPKKFRQKVNEIEKEPFFQGFYSYIASWLSSKAPKPKSGPMFQEIRKGEVWRLFTPAILHKDLLHILFNMLWLWVLGKQMEMRLPLFRFLLFIFIVGIGTNVAQYLMSGPYFLGFSGVVMGMAGFIWMRKKIAPWEGYPLHPTTFVFLAFFIFAMLGLQIFSFFMELSGRTSFAANIANTAHISGAIIGALLGRLSFFSWRTH